MANHLLEPKLKINVEENKGTHVVVSSLISTAKTYFKTPSNEAFSVLGGGKVSLTDKGTYDFYMDNDGTKGQTKSIIFNPHLANDARIELKHQPAQKYFGNGPQSVINGVLGSSEKYGDAEWLGFNGKDFDAKIFMKETAENIQMRFFKGEGQWIYLPSKIEIFDSQTNKLLAEEIEISSDSKVATVNLKLSEPSKNLNIKVSNFGIIPDGFQGSGHPAWLFVDEVVIN